MPPRRANTRQNNDANANPQIVMDRNTFMDMVQELAARQTQNTGGTNGQNQGGQTMFDRFMKQRPNCFTEANTPMDAEAWIDHMEKIFRVLNCLEVKKARFATYRLEGDASTWWKSVVASHAAGYENTLTWDVFKTQFDQRYFPASVREEYAREYQCIAQREDESVTDFQVRFQRLAGYARSIAKDEVDKIMKFKWALKNSIRNHIISNRYATMNSLIDSARDQELHQVDYAKQLEVQNQKRKKDDDSNEQNQSFKKNNGSSVGFKQNDHGYNTRSFRQRNGNQGNEQNTSSNKDKSGEKSRCQYCGKMHSGNTCHWTTGACFRCGEQGHTIRNCKAPFNNRKDNDDQGEKITANDTTNN